MSDKEKINNTELILESINGDELDSVSGAKVLSVIM